MAKVIVTEKKRKHIESTYDISLESYNSIREIQKFRCKLCKIPESQFNEPLVVDHDHDTGEVRGLLCKRCNSALGFFKDSPKRLIRAAAYLLQHGKKHPDLLQYILEAADTSLQDMDYGSEKKTRTLSIIEND